MDILTKQAAISRRWFACFSLATAFFYPCLPAFSAPSKGQDLSSRLAELQAKAKSGDFTARIKQDSYSALRKKTDVSTGTLQFSPPQSFRWEMSSGASSAKEPRKEIIVSNGTTLWRYNSATKHARSMPTRDLKELETLDAILKPATLTRKFKILEWDPKVEPLPVDTAGRMHLMLKPLDSSETHTLFLLLNEKTGWVEEVRIVYQNGNRAKLNFEGYTHAKVAKSRFDFTPPSGTVVDQQK